MKKTYISPAIEAQRLAAATIIALSLKTGAADSSDALVKTNEDWDIWGSDESAEDE